MRPSGSRILTPDYNVLSKDEFDSNVAMNVRTPLKLKFLAQQSGCQYLQTACHYLTVSSLRQ